MLDLAAPAPHQRSHGAAALGFVMDGARMRLARLAQQGSAKAFVLAAPGGGTDVVVLNTSGGLTGGDRLAYDFAVPPGGRLTAATQTAERIYRTAQGRARIAVTARVGAGGHLDWLPQETILFDGCAADRTTTIDLAPGATCLAVETLVLGRAAMGEAVARLDLRDRRAITRDGRPLHLEPLHMTGAHLGPRAALLDGARAAAALVWVAPGAPDALAPLRAALAAPGVTAAASAMEGRLVVRMLATDAWPLRRLLARVLTMIRRAPMPRVWQV